MFEFMVGVRDRCKMMPVATFACKPENVEGYSREGVAASIRTKRTVDSNEWVPEVSCDDVCHDVNDEKSDM